MKGLLAVGEQGRHSNEISAPKLLQSYNKQSSPLANFQLVSEKLLQTAVLPTTLKTRKAL